MTNFLIYYFSGVIIAAIIGFVFNVFITRDTSCNKKLHAYNAFKYGLFSWFTVITYVIFGTVVIIMSALVTIDNWITKKLR